MNRLVAVLLVVIFASVCHAQQSVRELKTSLDSARAAETKRGVAYQLHSVAKRKNLSAAEKAAARKLAIELSELTGDENKDARMISISTFLLIGDKTCIPAVNKLLADDHENVRVFAVALSHTLHDSDTVKALAQYVKEHGAKAVGFGDRVGSNPIEALQVIGTKEARAVLQDIFDHQPEHKELAAKALDALDRPKTKKGK